MYVATGLASVVENGIAWDSRNARGGFGEYVPIYITDVQTPQQPAAELRFREGVRWAGASFPWTRMGKYMPSLRDFHRRSRISVSFTGRRSKSLPVPRPQWFLVLGSWIARHVNGLVW